MKIPLDWGLESPEEEFLRKGYNQAIEEFKSRKQELIEGIESFYASQK